MVVGKLRLAATAPKAVITAATWLSLWVSTPRMTSSVVLWSGWAGCGMLGTVVWLLTARERIGHRRAAQVVRTVTVPCLRQGPYRDTPAGPAAARTAPGPVVDRSSTRHHGQS